MTDRELQVFEKSDRGIAIRVARDIERAATEWLAEGRREFASDRQALCVYRQNTEHLRDVADEVWRQNLQKARDIASVQDTVVRDHLPESFFKLLEKHGIEW